MKTTLSIFIALFLPLYTLTAQEKEWKQMNDKEKQSYMVKLSREIIQEFGPDYYRADAPYVFESDVFSTGVESQKKYEGRKLLVVKFQYDDTLELFNSDYLAKVSFWADSGEPTGVMFGCDMGYTFVGKSYEECKAEQHSVMPFYRVSVPLKTVQTGKADAIVNAKERQIVDRCVELIKKYGPDYYNPDANYNIETVIYRLDGKRDCVSQNNGREYYLITFDYDLNKGLMKNYFSSAIRMWKDTGEVWNIEFGNGEKFDF